MKEQRWNRVITEDGEIISSFPEGWEFKAYALGIPKKIDPLYGGKNFNGYKKSIEKNYCFVGQKLSEMDIKPEVLTKLIYLSSYMNYDGNLMKTERTRMRKNDLPEILKVTKRKVDDFLKEVNEYIAIGDDDSLSMNTSFFYRGKLKPKMFNSFVRAYFEGIRSLYNSVSSRQHKQLGYMLMMIPYMNRNFNVLCNPDDILETDAEAIRTISFNQFCELVGYNSHNSRQLKSTYKKIAFPDHDGKERDFVRIIDEYGKVYINPLIFFAGDSFQKVEILNTLFS